MIEFYKAATPNAHKVTILLEELGLPYKTHPINLQSNEQKGPDFIAMNPNGRIPVIVDTEGPFGQKQTVFESGAILYYLAEKTGKFFGHDLGEKTKIMQWLMFQMSGIGPMFGNLNYGKNLTPKNPQYVERFEKEVKRLLNVMNIQLSQHTYLAGENYSIADMATYPWVAGLRKMNVEDWLATVPSVRRWMDLLAERPAVKKAMN